MALDTTPTAIIEYLFDVPAWVDALTVMAWCRVSISNLSGSNQNVATRIRIGGEADGFEQVTVQHNATGAARHIAQRAMIGVAGSTLMVEAEGWVTSGTNNDNAGHLWVLAIGTR